MTIRNQFDCVDCLDAVGAYDRRGSLELNENIQFTMQLADFSSSFAAEAFEPRFYSWVAQNATGVGNQAKIGIAAIRKPVVIEKLSVTASGGGAIGFYMGLGTPLFTDGAVGGGNLKFDIGGAPSDAEIWTSNDTATLPGTGDPPISLVLDTQWESPPGFRAWVPPGELFMIAATGTSLSVLVETIGREVADIPRKRRA